MTTRRGMAPLELVLVMPILMSLVATMFWVGNVGSARLTALSDTRGQTWQKRAEAAPGEVLKFDHDPAPSYVAVPVSNPRVGPAGDALTTAPFGPWAHEDVVFARLPDGEIATHEELLTRLGERNPGWLGTFLRLLPGVKASRRIDPARGAR